MLIFPLVLIFASRTLNIVCARSILSLHCFYNAIGFHYRKNSKNWDTWNNYHNCPTIGTAGFYIAVLCSKDADRITNREDPDQTAPWGAVWSGSALFAQTYLSQYLKLLRYTIHARYRKLQHEIFHTAWSTLMRVVLDTVKILKIGTP